MASNSMLYLIVVIHVCMYVWLAFSFVAGYELSALFQ